MYAAVILDIFFLCSFFMAYIHSKTEQYLSILLDKTPVLRASCNIIKALAKLFPSVLIALSIFHTCVPTLYVFSTRPIADSSGNKQRYTSYILSIASAISTSVRHISDIVPLLIVMGISLVSCELYPLSILIQ